MAQVRNNLVVQGLSGMLGKQLVLRTRKNGKTFVSAAPRRRADYVPSEAQKKQQARFRAAVAYAKEAKNRQEYRAGFGRFYPPMFI